MARCNGPLFSFDASGSLGGAIVFSKWKGRNYVRQHAVPSNPRSALQLSVRALMAYVAAKWADIDAAVQAEWDDEAAAAAVSPFNAYVSRNGKRWTQFLYPITGPEVSAGTPATLGTLTATGGKGIIEVSQAITTAANGIAAAFFLTPADDTALTRSLLRLIRSGTTGPIAGTIQHVPAGTWYVRSVSLTAGGAASAPATSSSVTVT